MSVWEGGLVRKDSLAYLQVGGGTKPTSSHTSVRVVCWDIHHPVSSLATTADFKLCQSVVRVVSQSFTPERHNFISAWRTGQAFLCGVIPPTSLLPADLPIVILSCCDKVRG